jgi:hypothetical protein
MLRKLLVIGILTVLLFSPLFVVSNVKADPPSSYTLNYSAGDGQRGMDYTTATQDFTAVIHSNVTYTGSPSDGGSIDMKLYNVGMFSDGIYLSIMFGTVKTAWSGDMSVFDSYNGYELGNPPTHEYYWSDPSNETLTISYISQSVNIYMNDVLLINLPTLDTTFNEYSIRSDNGGYGFPMQGSGVVSIQINNISNHNVWEYTPAPTQTPAPTPQPVAKGTKAIVFNYTDFEQLSQYGSPSPANNFTVKALPSNFVANGTVQVNRDTLIYAYGQIGGGYGDRYDYSLIFADFSASGNISEETLYQHNFLEFDFSNSQDDHFYQHLAGELDKTSLFGIDGAMALDFNFTLTNSTLYVYNEYGVINEGGSLFTAFKGSQIKSVWLTSSSDEPQDGFIDITFPGQTVSGGGGGGAVPTPAPTFQPTQQPSSSPNSQQPTTSNWWLLVPFVGVGAGAVGVTILLKAKGKPRRRKH